MLVLIVVALLGSIMAQDASYYSSIDSSATNDDLKSQLKTLINPHTVLDYDSVWAAMNDLDTLLPSYPCNTKDSSMIPDIYSGYCWIASKTDASTGGSGECGNYAKEGDCFNREHIWPKSWFGGFDNGKNAQTDLFELWGSDGYVNGIRGNNPIGIVSTVQYNSTNGCLIGTCSSSSGYTGTCFEPPAIYKGAVARSYFYLATAYWNEWDCCDTDGVDGSDIKPWMETILRSWHNTYPVSDFEINRNNKIYSTYQHNRNPFIDNPQWVNQISDF